MRPKNHLEGIKYPNRIGHCIKKYGYTFTEVADEIGIGRRTLSYYIAGERSAPRYCLEKIARLLGCDVGELTGSSILMPESHQGKEIVSRTKPIDTSYIVGRDTVANRLLAYLHPVPAVPRIKVCVLYALPGAGKTTVFKLLRKRLAEDLRNSIIHYEFDPSRDMTPAEHLDVFLAQMGVELGIPPPESTKLPPLQERISQVINEIVSSQLPLILVLDDAQMMLEQDGNLATVWKQFLQSFIEVEHQATLYMATREWPGWIGRERVFFAELELEPLSADAAVQLWHNLGFTDVPTDLLLEATHRCGSNPQMIEIRAKGLQGHYIYGWQDESLSQASQKSEHRLLIEKLLSEDYVFDTRWDIEARKVLEQVISKRISYQATQVLDLLSASPVPLPFSFLERLYPSTKQVFEELLRCSLVDRDSLFTERVNILPFAREAHLYTLNSTNRLEEAERQVIGIYAEWLNSRELRADEKSKVIAEFAALLLKHERLLEAAENLIRYGWIAFNAGYGARLARLARNIMQRCDGLATADNKCGAILLQYVLLPFSGVSIDEERRAVDYQMIYDLALTGKVTLEPVTEAHIVHHLAVSLMKQSKFQEAESLLNTCCARIISANPSQVDVDLQASLLEKQGWLLATWCEYVEEQGDIQRAKTLREQAIAVYKQCSSLLLAPGVQTPLKESVIKKRLARCYNNIAYHLNRLGLFEDALRNVDQSLTLKEQGYVQLGSLAASYGEKSIALAGLGRFQEALYYDEKAYADLEQHIRAGHTHLQSDKWMYQVNRGRLYLTLGNFDEAEKLLKEALLKVPLRRNMYKMRANEAIHEIDQWHQEAKASHYQLDWRWVERYRKLVSFDAYWWLNPAGPFTQEEQHQWDQLFTGKLDEAAKRQLGALIAQSRDRELEAAITEQREPALQYPAIDIEDVRMRIMNLLRLDEDIARDEKNVIVRRLYHDTIEEELWFLRLIEACYEGNSEHFWDYNVRLNPPPTREEMQYTLSCVGSMLYQGLHHSETREVSEQLVQFMHKELQISLDTSPKEDRLSVHEDIQHHPQHSQREVSPRVAKRFFEAVFQKSHFEGWQVIIDNNASGARVEQGLRQFIIPDKSLSLSKIRDYLSHELAGHIARCVAGERSSLGLLGIHTRNSLLTEEGLAVYHDRQLAAMQGQAYDGSSIWIGTLATGLASGVMTPPLTFNSLFQFFEVFLLLRRLLKRQDGDPYIARQHARRLALIRCIRTFRGVPDLHCAGVCYTKDALYLRGFWMIEQVASRDKSVLNRLSVGVVGLEQLPDLEELGITVSVPPLQELAQDPGLESYVLSFETESPNP